MSISVPAKGWYLEVDDSNGNTLYPRVLSSPEWKATVNGLPRVDIPVPRDDKWRDDVLEDATVRLFRDGAQLPIDSVQTATEAQGGSQAQTVLECVGGRELLEATVEKDFDQQEIHLAAQNFIDNNTTYTSNVDTPPNTREDSVDQFDVDSGTDLQNQFTQALDATDPFTVETSSIDVAQSDFVFEAENNRDGSQFTNGTEYSGDAPSDGEGAAALFDAVGEAVEVTFTLDYAIPAEDFQVGVRGDNQDASGNSLELFLDGNSLGSQSILTSSVGWAFDPLLDPDIGGGWIQPSSDVSAGSHTVRIEMDASGTGDFNLDLVAVHDERYSYTTDNTLETGPNGGRWLDGPELFPDAETVRFLADDMIRSVAGGTAAVTMNDTSGSQQLELSNDNGDTWPGSTSNGTSVDHDFSSLGPSLECRVTFSRFGTRDDSTPQNGFNGQTLDTLDLDADLSSTPIIVDERVEGDLVDVLKLLADRADQLWEVQHDGSGLTVEWTTPGQRNSDATPDVIDYQSSKRTGPEHVFEEATVIGSAQRVSGEQFTSNHGVAVDLNQDRLVAGREVVYDPDTRERFEPDKDYNLNRVNGTITTRAAGSMADSTTFEIDYWYSTRNTWTKSGVGSPNTLTQRIGDLPSDRACGQAARLLVEKLDTPLVEATITVPRTETNISPVEDLNPDIVPTDGERVRIAQITHSPEEIVIKLRNRQTVEEAADEIRNQITAVKSRV